MRMAIALQHIFISIHALREEGDCITVKSMHRAKQFLSTPSARRATLALTALQDFRLYFYPRPPRGGRLWLPLVWCPCAGISIHALREEGDCRGSSRTSVSKDFYPRPPRGGRHVLQGNSHAQILFLSTPSARRATKKAGKAAKDTGISIHALREEGDSPSAASRGS